MEAGKSAMWQGTSKAASKRRGREAGLLPRPTVVRNDLFDYPSFVNPLRSRCNIVQT
jgi:hypothetical protein